MASWRQCPSAKLLRQLQYTGRIVVFAAVFPSRSCDFGSESRRLQPLLAFGLWVSLRHPIFTTGSMPFWLADVSKETTALSVLFSFQYFLRLFPRFTALSGHWPFAGDSEASYCQPMPLRVGTPEWAYSLFLRRDRGLRGPLHPSQYEFEGFPESVSSVNTRVLAGLSVLPLHGRLPLSMCPWPLWVWRGDGNGRPLLPSLARHSLRADLTALDR